MNEETHLITQCPHCDMVFKLTAAQMNIAHGAVRCGACLQVFRASEHIIDAPLADQGTPDDLGKILNDTQHLNASDNSSDDASDLTENIVTDDIVTDDIVTDGLIHDDLINDNPFEDNTDSQNSAAPKGLIEDGLIDETLLANSTAEQQLDELGISEWDASKKQDSYDESWAEALLKELDEEVEDENDVAATEGLNSTAQLPSAEASIDQSTAPQPPNDNPFGELSDDFATSSQDSSTSPDDKPQTLSDTFDKAVENPLQSSRIRFEDLSDTFKSISNDWENQTFKSLDEEALKAGAADESWAESMLKELESDEKDYDYSALEIVKNEQELEEEEQRKHFQEQRAKIKAEREEQPTRRRNEAPKANDEADGFFAHFDENINDESFNVLLEDHSETGTKENPSAQPNTTNESTAPRIAIAEWQDQNPYFVEEPTPKRWGRKLLMGSLCVLFMTLGIAQYAYFNSQTLAKNPDYRPTLAAFCGAVGCALPPQRDLSKLAISHVHKRPHPDFQNAFRLDAKLQNRASFGQAFPHLELALSDSSGNEIGKRVFSPQEYVTLDNVDLSNIPSNANVHITLDIVQPSKLVGGYHLSVYTQHQQIN